MGEGKGTTREILTSDRFCSWVRRRGGEDSEKGIEDYRCWWGKRTAGGEALEGMSWRHRGSVQRGVDRAGFDDHTMEWPR